MNPLLLLACAPKSADSDRPRPDSHDSAAGDSTTDSTDDSTHESGDDSQSGDSDSADSGTRVATTRRRRRPAPSAPRMTRTRPSAGSVRRWLVVQGELYFELNAEYVPTSGWAGGLDGRERPSRTVDVDGDGVRDGDGVEDHVFSAAGYPDEFGNGGAWVIDGTERGSLSVEEDAYASFVATTESVRSGQYVRAVSSPVDLDKDGYLGDGVEDVVAHTYESDGSYEQGFSVMFGVPSGTSDFRADATWRMSTPSWSQVTLDANDDGADDIVFGAVSSAGDINGIFYGGPER